MTTDYLGPCGAPGLEPCPNAATRITPFGPLCDAHRKRLQPSRAGGTPLSAKVQERMDPKRRLLEACHAYCDADSENDSSADKVEARLLLAARSYGRHMDGDELQQKLLAQRRAIRRGQKRARAEGKRIGGVPKLTWEQARDAVAQFGSISKAAAALGVQRQTVSRALHKKPPFTEHGAMHEVFSPPAGGGSEPS